MNAWMKTCPTWLLDHLERATKWAGINWERSSGERFADDQRRPQRDLRGAEVWGSTVREGKEAWTIENAGVQFEFGPYEPVHVIALDIDKQCALIPSSTPGHHHLVINHRLEWSRYKTLLHALAEAGVIEFGFYDAAVQREETFLRLPWVHKGSEQADAQRALAEWLDEDDRPEFMQTPEAVEAFLAEPDVLPF